MKITVKSVDGKECVIDIPRSEKVAELKKKVHESFGVDVWDQMLIYGGRPLTDNKFLSSYTTLTDYSKVNLFVKKRAQNRDNVNRIDGGIKLFKSEMFRVLRLYYEEREAHAIVNQFMKDLKEKTDALTFDDLERLATALLQDEENLAS